MTLPPSARTASPDPLMRHYARSRAWCDWEDFAAWQPRLLAAMAQADGPAVSPFQLLSLPGITAAQQHDGAVRWMQARLACSRDARADVARNFAARAAMARPRAAGQRIRLGYLSNDFQMHATALLLAETLEAHDHARFEVHAYNYGADDGRGMRQRLQASFDGGFHDISDCSDAEAASRIHADGIDILIDLKGYTAGTRSMVLAYRPAPVQVSYLGYPGTLGAGLCDYLVSDRFITPACRSADYSEALACLPNSYQPHGRAAALPEAPGRASLGLPDDALVLCCFNQAWKFTPEVFGLWCKMLAQVPDSVLWLLGDERIEANLRQIAAQHGVTGSRLIFAPDLPQAAHLARLQQADLVLDTAPYNAHTTASDALWAGVPLLTWAGDTFASRVAGSLLHAVGLPELVTHSLADYAALLLALASDRPRLRTLRARLAGLREAAALFDVEGYSQDLEALYSAMWARHLQGLAPASLDLSSVRQGGAGLA